MATKLAIVWRQELKELPLGKKMTQAGHASHLFLTQNRVVTISQDSIVDTGIGEMPVTKSLQCIVLTEKEITWINDNYRKIVLTTRSLANLLTLKTKAEELGVEAKLIEDAGFTCFDGPVVTCLSLGPDSDDLIDLITGHNGPLGRLQLA